MITLKKQNMAQMCTTISTMSASHRTVKPLNLESSTSFWSSVDSPSHPLF